MTASFFTTQPHTQRKNITRCVPPQPVRCKPNKYVLWFYDKLAIYKSKISKRLIRPK